MCVILLSVIVDIMVITTILLCSLSMEPWLYPFLFYLQVCNSLFIIARIHSIIDAVLHYHICLQVTPYLAQYFPVTFSAIQPYVSIILLLFFYTWLCNYYYGTKTGSHHKTHTHRKQKTFFIK